MPLKAKRPTDKNKRLKLFLFGTWGTGKTRCALRFPRSYFIDGEAGTDRYVDLFEESESDRLQTTDVDEVIDQVRCLATTEHNYLTLCIDPITTIETDLILRAEDIHGEGFQLWRMRDRVLRRLVNLLYGLDMNVIVTAHGKIEYGDNMKKIGTTFDAWKRWPYVFDLGIELYRRGAKTYGIVRKTRMKEFPEGDDFLFSYEAICDRYGQDIIEKKATPKVLAAPDEIVKLNRLLESIVVPDGTVERWKTKAGVEEFADMTADDIAKCIEYLEKKGRGEK